MSLAFCNQHMIFLRRWDSFVIRIPSLLFPLYICILFSPRFSLLFVTSFIYLVTTFLSKERFSPLKWHCSFHKNLNGATLRVIPSSFNLLLFLSISDLFFDCVERSIASVPSSAKNFISNPTVWLPCSQ